MRACFYLTDHRWSGRARTFAEAARGFGLRGVECTVACTQGDVRAGMTSFGHEVVGFRAGIGVLRSAWQLGGLLRSRDIDVVFVHHEREQVVAALGARLAGRGAVVRRLPALSAPARGRLARLAARLVPTALLFAFEEDRESATAAMLAGTLSSFVALPGLGGAPPRPAATTPLDSADQSGSAPHHSAFRITVFAGESSQARVLPVLRAAALVVAQGVPVTLQIVGSALDADALRINAAALHIGDRTAITPVADTPGAARALESTDLVWVVAEADDAIYGIVDAFAAGVALFTDRSTLSQRLVPVGGSDCFVPAGEPAVQAAHLMSIATNTERRRQLASAGRNAFRRWSSMPMADAFERAAVAVHDAVRQSR